jgi:hypothetical protein
MPGRELWLPEPLLNVDTTDQATCWEGTYIREAGGVQALANQRNAASPQRYADLPRPHLPVAGTFFVVTAVSVIHL